MLRWWIDAISRSWATIFAGSFFSDPFRIRRDSARGPDQERKSRLRRPCGGCLKRPRILADGLRLSVESRVVGGFELYGLIMPRLGHIPTTVPIPLLVALLLPSSGKGPASR
jgi:hypothetical protein